MSHREIAAALDISPSTVEGQLAIAMAPSEGRRSPFPEKNLKKSQIGLVVSQVRLVLFVNGQ